MTRLAEKVFEGTRHHLGLMTLADLAETTGLTTDQVWSGMRTLISHGLVSKGGRRGTYRLTPDGFAGLVDPPVLTSGRTGPRPNKEFAWMPLRERLWRAIRACRKASLHELSTLASRDEPVDHKEAKNYMNALVRAGYLTRLPGPSKNGSHGPGQTRYLLVRNTGPKPPQWNKAKRRVFDPNTGDTHELA